MTSDIKPFTIAVPDEDIASLKTKLQSFTLPKPFDFENDWDYGSPKADIRRLATYWRDSFDWRAQEARINKLPQFTTPVQVADFGTINIHFVHQKSSNPASIPLLFCHGWPGSFLEVEKILPLLTEPAAGGASFHVVAPSLPNYAFSEGVTQKGFGITQYAETLHKVMQKLGYIQYVTQGGDWGYFITRQMGVMYPESCLASHTNIPVCSPPTFRESPLLWLQSALFMRRSDDEDGFARAEWFNNEGRGYSALQSTKPSTLGFALADSPVAVLAWIYEKLHDWTDNYPWTDDEILTWISIYVFSTAGPEASVRIYYEAKHAPGDTLTRLTRYNHRVPLGISSFPLEFFFPRLWWFGLGRIVFEKRHKSGGHFAAHERPEELVDDLQAMFGRSGGANSIARHLSKL